MLDETEVKSILGEHFGEPISRYLMDETATMIHFTTGKVRIIETATVDKLVRVWAESHQGDA